MQNYFDYPSFFPESYIVFRALLAYLILFLLSSLYAVGVYLLNSRKLFEGFVFVEVVIGVAFTLLVTTVAFIDVSLPGWAFGLIYFVAFCFSGTPMAIGDLTPYIVRRYREQVELLRHANS